MCLLIRATRSLHHASLFVLSAFDCATAKAVKHGLTAGGSQGSTINAFRCSDVARRKTLLAWQYKANLLGHCLEMDQTGKSNMTKDRFEPLKGTLVAVKWRTLNSKHCTCRASAAVIQSPPF